MFKTMLLIGAAAVSFPALAQTDPSTGTMPAQPASPSEPAQPDPNPSTPTDPAPTTDPMAPTGEPAPQSAPAAGQAATPVQIGQIVEQEFATYDGDGSGELNEMEFAAWMKKLRTATEPTVDPESAEVKNWITQAYAAADADKSGGVSKAELVTFLSRGS